MRISVAVGFGLVALVALTGCAPEATEASSGDLGALLLTRDEAARLGNWVVTPDDGPVEGDTEDCTGAPYDWPEQTMIAHASQFLDRPDESVAIVVKQFDDEAAVRIDAVRSALAPCAPESGEVENGAMITPVGDDSFAYQSRGSDDSGEFTFSNMLIACGDYLLEVLSYSYSGDLDQAELENLVSPALDRIDEVGNCAA